MGNPSRVQAAIAQAVNQLYGGAIFNTFPTGGGDSDSFLQITGVGAVRGAEADTATGGETKETASTGDANAAPANSTAPNPNAPRSVPSQAKAPESTSPSLPLSVSPSSNPASNTYYDWTARIRFKKYELNGSFSVLLFLGSPIPSSTHAAQWRASPAFVGAHHAFVNSAAGQCENCRAQAEADVVVEGFVHLNGALARRSGLGSFEPEVVVPYLRRELAWRVQRVCDAFLHLLLLFFHFLPLLLSLNPLFLSFSPIHLYTKNSS